MNTKVLIICAIGIIGITTIQYSYAAYTAPLFGPPGPCFDSFMVFTDAPLTEHSIMENYVRNIESNYPDWQMSDRDWSDKYTKLQLPAIICTEFVADGMKHYRMAKWVDSHTISSFENHRDDSLCDKWLAPIDDEVKIRWDKPNYLPIDAGVLRVSDASMNLDDKKMDSFDIHVWSDTDHTGIELTIYEIDNDSGIFEGTVFFTPEGKSGGTTLLVEDAVYADHKFSVGSARIASEFETQSTGSETNINNDFRNVDGEILCKGYTSGSGFLEYPECGPIDQFVVHVLILVLPVVGIVAGFVYWRKRK